MKSSLAEEMRPRTWSDYIGIPNTIAQVQHTISINNPRGGIMIWGPTGVGKTSLAKLIVSSWLCLNREHGDYNPCGKCDVCLGRNIDNFFYYTPSGSKDTGDGKSSAQVVGDMITRSKQAPYHMDNKSGAFRQFLVINEMQLLSRATHNSLLDAIEDAPETTTWILTGMDTSASLMDSEVMSALANRCLYVRIPQNTERDIKSRLLNKVEGLSVEAAHALSILSNKNMREAWRNLSIFWPRLDAHQITSEMIYEELGGGCSEEARREFWRALALSDVDTLCALVDSWLSKISPDVIKELIVKDIISKPAIFKTNNYIREFCTSLYSDLSKSPLIPVLLPYLGCIDLYSDVVVNQITNTDKEDMKVADQLALELNKVLSNEVPLSGKTLKNKAYGLLDTQSAFIVLSSIEEIMSYYSL